MSAAPEELAADLARVMDQKVETLNGIENLKRLSGGASQETWAFDGTTPKGSQDRKSVV